MQQRLFTEPLQIRVRTGLGSIIYADDPHCPRISFTDEVELIDRIPREHSGWQSIRYKKQRYQLFGGVRTNFFICLNSPIVPTPSYY